MSEDDAHRLKANILKWIEDNLKIVKESPEETLRAIAIDFFKPQG